MNVILDPIRAELARGAAHRAPRRAVLAVLVALAGPLVTGVPDSAASLPADEGRVLAAIPTPLLRVGFPISTGGIPFSQPPVMADLDLDGRAEILAVDDNGRIHVVRGNGAPFGGSYSLDIGGAPTGPLAVGDIDNDGFVEIVSVSASGRVSVYSNEGALKGFAMELPGTPVGGAVLTELEESGRLAILVVTSDGLLYAIKPEGGPFPGFPVAGSATAVSGPFAYVGPDNFPRIGYLGANPDRVQVFFTYAQRDTQASAVSVDPFTGATPVAGARPISLLPDSDHVYVMSRHGSLKRLDPDLINGGTVVTSLIGLPNDSVFVQPSLVDITGDLVPELGVLALRGDTLRVYLIDGESGAPMAGFPRLYLGGQPVGGMVCADIGDDSVAELILNRGGDKVSCVRSNATEAWTISGLPSITAPAVGDLDDDGGIDMAVVTTTGMLYAYNLGNAGVGSRAIEWSVTGGSPRHDGRHRLRDRARLHSFWPPPITPSNTFTTRPMIGVFDGDGRPDILWSDYDTGKTFGFGASTVPMAGMPQAYGQGAVLDAPAIGEVTGDSLFESVQATSTGRIVWSDPTGVTGQFIVDDGMQLAPPSLADVDGDGVLDVIVGSASGRLYAVELVGTPSILPGFPVTTAGAITLPVALGDVSGNGQTDIVVVGGAFTLHAYPRTGVSALAGWPRVFAPANTLHQPILIPVAGQAGLCVAFGRSTGADSVVAHLVGGNGIPLPGWPRRLTNAFDLISGPIAGDFDNDGAVDLVFATGGDSVIVFNAAGNRPLYRHYPTAGNLELAAMVDLDLDKRPEIVVVSDLSTILGIRFNGLTVRSFTRQLITLEPGAPPAFGDVGNDGVLDMAASDLGQPILYSWGEGSWRSSSAPWPMKGHDRYRTHAFSGPTVVGVGDPGAAGPPPRGTGIARAVPNPARGAVAFTHTRPLVGAYEALVFDVTGRLVRSLARGEAPASGRVMAWSWDGRDEAGASAPAGIYFYQLRDAAGTLRQKVVRLR